MNILIVRVSSLGDVVHNMPMVADILHHHPGANIDWVVEDAYASLVGLNTGVHKVIPFSLRRWRRNPLAAKNRAEMSTFHRTLRAEAYDFVFDTQGLIKTGIVMSMARLAPGGQRIGLANATEGSGYEPLSRFFHTRSVPVGTRTHAVLRARMVAAATLGYTVDEPADFALRMPDIQLPAWLPSEPYAAFFHATARASKRWDDANWIETARELEAWGMPVLLPWGSDDERRAAEHLAGHMRNARVLPRLPMMEAVLLAQRAALAIGVDTGLTHIAAAFNRPTIELYCDSPRWKTEGNWSSNIINLGDLKKPPGVAEVRAAIASLLGSEAGQSRRGIIA